MKKIIAFVLTAVMCLGCLVMTGTAEDENGIPFSDVAAEKWYYDNVKFVYDNDLMTGVTTTTFEPTAPLTRAQFATILCRLAGGTPVKVDKFSDVSNQWFAGYVGWAAEAGIVNGYNDGTFLPNKNISRQELAKAMVCYIEFEGSALPRASTAPEQFADSADIGTWAKPYVETLRRAGILNGDTSENVNPKADITRAETATMIRNLIEAFAAAWQGYEPEAKAANSLLGAAYLYWHGTLVAGGLGSELIEGEGYDYPVLSAFVDDKTAIGVPTPHNSIGVSLSVFEGFDVRKSPVVKISYAYEGMDAPETLKGQLTANPVLPSLEWTATYPNLDGEVNFDFVSDSEENGYRTAYIDLTDIFAQLTTNNGLSPATAYDLNIDIVDVLVLPFEENYEGDGRFNIRYIGFFESVDAAKDFDAYSEEYDDYLKNYFVSCQVDLDSIPADKLEEYEAELVERIDAIVNSESITPESVEANGGSCWYVSSINGDDSNDGKTPETAWKTLSKLEDESEMRKKGLQIQYKGSVKPGDAVFFERGSKFYGTRERASWVKNYYGYEYTSNICLFSMPGVTYSAYGEGAKPLFTGMANLNEGAGEWTEVADNIWKIVRPEGVDAVNFIGSDVGHITFNGGQYVGVRVIPKYSDIESARTNPNLAPGMTTVYHGIMTGDGENYFETGGTACEKIEDALHNNFEFFHDMYEGELYLYFDKGNPGEYFDTIEIATDANPLNGNANHEILTVFDNLHFANTSSHGGRLGNRAIIQNCEIGYCGGELGSAESGIECFGSRDGVAMIGNYVHDVFDGPLSMQATDDTDAECNIENITLTDNVIVACGNGFEIWNKFGYVDENGIAKHKIRNVVVENNMMAYIGYGLTQRQGCYGDRAAPLVFCTSAMEGENCLVKDNITINSYSQIGFEFFSSDTQSRGWRMDGNVFIMAEGRTDYCTRRDCFNSYWQHTLAHYGFWVTVPYEERYLTYMASLGIGNSNEYYTVNLDADFETGLTADPDKVPEASGKYVLGSLEKYSECPFMTGYYVYR